jgi:putative oxidoreductase
MKLFDSLGRYQSQALGLLRIVAALLLIEHGTQKLFGFPDSGQAGGSLGGLMLLAGILEALGGLLVGLGLLTRPVAFLLAGEMAVAYFMAHFPKSFFPVNNDGDAAVLFCFVFFYLMFAGPGAFALDNRRSS